MVRAVEAALAAAAGTPQVERVVSAWLGGNPPSSLDALYRRLADASRDVAGVAPRVLARPGQRLDVPLRAGDAILRVALGEPGFAHLAVLVDGRLLSRDELAAGQLRAEGDRPGQYAWVIEAGARHHRADDRFARLVTDRSGVVPPGQIVLRPLSSRADDVPEHLPGDDILWSDETVDSGWPAGTHRAERGDLASLPLVADNEDVDIARSEAGTLIDSAALSSLEMEDVAAPGFDEPVAEATEGWTVAATDDAWHDAYDSGVESVPGDPDQRWEAAEAEPPVTTLRMRQGPAPGPRRVRARILWPALGFPAVITPPATPSPSTFEDGDATRCICVLLLSDTELLSKEEAARYLRFVPWAERGRRHIRPGQPGTFREEELAVRNGGRQALLSDPRPKDRLGEFVRFGANGNDRNGIVASLGKKVKELYAADGLQYMHEIRIYDTATARMPLELYHLFWNNESPDETAPSDEMAMLVRLHARRERSKLGTLWQQTRRRPVEGVPVRIRRAAPALQHDRRGAGSGAPRSCIPCSCAADPRRSCGSPS